MIRAILFDLGDTIITEESVGGKHTPEADLEKVPHIEEALMKLKEKYRLAVVTNTSTSTEKDIRIALRRIGLEDYFDAVVTSVDVGCEKPGEKIFSEALKRLCIKPTETVMVGNRIKTDILGANKLGIASILFKWNDRYDEDITSPLEKPTYTISSLIELPGILVGLEKRKRADSRI